jgi:arylsulfatase A-like enzyme
MPVRVDHRPALRIVTLLAVANIGLGSSLAVPGGADDARAASKDRPNIILIQTDDQTLTQLNRRVMPRTRDLLVRHGTRFTNYIATTAQCCPSRASLLTGQYAHNHGVTSNQDGYPGLVDKGNVLPVWLQQAGYRTIHLGKFLNGYNRFATPDSVVAPGWDVWRTVLADARYYNYDYFVNGRSVHRGRHRVDNLTSVLDRDATRLAGHYAKRRRPFYLQLDERAPHIDYHQRDPFGNCAHAAIPQPVDEGRFRGARPPKPPSYNENDISDKPPFLQSAPKLGPRYRRQIAKRWRCAIESLVGVDRTVAHVYEAVKKAGDLGRTVFMFLSDNGQFYGEHRVRVGKVFPYEEALHLPLVMRVPKRYRDGARRLKHTAKPVANIDLAPTILRLAGASPCAPGEGCRTMDGRSLTPILKRTGRWPRGRGLLTEYRVPDLPRYSTCRFAGIRTRRQIYVEHYRVVDPDTGECVDVNPPEVERYNLRSDRFELRNLCFGGTVNSCPRDAEQVDLETRLAKLRDCAGVAGRDERVDGHPFCE